MNARTLLLAFWPLAVQAQGYAGLGADAEGYLVPQPEPNFSFPEDHGAHPGYRIEWWYVTANLEGPDGTGYGLQWTLFRSALSPETGPGWQEAQVWMGHAAVTAADTHRFAQRMSRGGIGTAGVEAEPFDAWIDEWEMSGATLDDVRLKATGTDFGYDVQLTAQGPLVFHGEDGYSVKSAEGQASYYYSQPFYTVEGKLILPEGEIPVTGSAWLDREWSSQPLAETQEGWDWFSLSFDTGAKLMGFRLRETGGGTFTSATWIGPEGESTAYDDGAFTAEPIRSAEVDGRDVPVEWRVRLPAHDLDVTVEAENEAAWMGTLFSYWEGPVRLNGSHDGRGYLEMTGYE